MGKTGVAAEGINLFSSSIDRIAHQQTARYLCQHGLQVQTFGNASLINLGIHVGGNAMMGIQVNSAATEQDNFDGSLVLLSQALIPLRRI
jgi:hypothetical protein